MVKKFYPINLFFEAEVEYSKDNGTTWLTLAADTELEIDPLELPANGRVKVRSTNAITSLDSGKLKFNSRLFESVNIKNGKSLTTLANTFKYSNINNLRVANVPNVVSINNMASFSYINNLKLSEALSVTDAYYAFAGAYIRALDNIALPEATNVERMFSSLHNNKYMGDIFVGKDGVQLNAQYMFSYAEVEQFPNVEFIGRGDSGDGTRDYVFQALNSKYMLHNKIGKIGRGDRLGYAFQNTQLKFSGMELYTKNNMLHVFDSINLEYPFSKLVKQAGSSISSSFFSNMAKSHITTQEMSFINDSSRQVIVELPGWIPSVIELSANVSIAGVVGADSIGAVGMNYRKIKDGKLYTSKYVESLNGVIYDDGIANPYPSANIDFCRNGTYGYQDGADYKVFNDSDALVQTFAGLTVKTASFNSDSTLLIVVTGGSIDVDAMGTQSVTNIVTVYDIGTATAIKTFNTVLADNEAIIGVHLPAIGSNLQIVRSMFSKEEAFHNYYSATSTNIDSYDTYTDALDKTIALSQGVSKVVNNYGEDNEFVCINTTNGSIVRCFGK